MKKARIILAAVAILSIAGGVLAFKVAEFGALTYYTTNQFNAIAPASNAIDNAITTTSGGARVYWTTIAGNNATAFNTVVAGN